MKYMTGDEAVRKWGLSVRSAQTHCRKGNVAGVNLQGKAWFSVGDSKRLDNAVDERETCPAAVAGKTIGVSA